MTLRHMTVGVVVIWLSGPLVRAEGHGPAFGLAPPTLGRGAWSSDTAAMSLGTDAGSTVMFRETLGYGLTRDLQANVSFPLGPPLNRLRTPPRTRIGSMMGGFGNVEGSVLWRFQRRAPAVGTRYESALLLGGSLPTERQRAGVRVGPAVNAAVVTGRASRSWYAWAGGGFQRYFRVDNDRLGDLPYSSVVVGWRPPWFRHDYPKPDWRIFVESLAEFPQRDRLGGLENHDSGGERVLVGPSLLGLYGRWGVEVGALAPVYQRLNGRQPTEDFRVKTVFTWWF